MTLRALAASSRQDLGDLVLSGNLAVKDDELFVRVVTTCGSVDISTRVYSRFVKSRVELFVDSYVKTSK
jgi:hypothetical protein